MSTFAIGEVANDILTVSTLELVAPTQADIASELTSGKQVVEVKQSLLDAVENNVYALVGRQIDVSDSANPTLVALVVNQLAEWKRRLHLAAQSAFEQNKRHWPNITRSSDPSEGTDKWIFHNTALISIIAAGNYRSDTNSVVTVSDQNIEALITGWEQTVNGTHVATRSSIAGWYDDLVNNSGHAAEWAGVSVADGATLYSDTVTINTGLLRGMDTEFTNQSHTNNRVPENFTPETETLERTA